MIYANHRYSNLRNFYYSACNNQIFCNYDLTDYVNNLEEISCRIRKFEIKPNYHIHLIYTKINKSMFNGSMKAFIDNMIKVGLKVFIHYKRDNDLLRIAFKEYKDRCKVMGFSDSRKFIFKCSPWGLVEKYNPSEEIGYLVIGYVTSSTLRSMIATIFLVNKAKYEKYIDMHSDGSIEKYYNMQLEHLFENTNNRKDDEDIIL